jgi:hypothetical protein
VEQLAAHDHRPPSVIDEIDGVDLEGDVRSRLFEDGSRSGSYHDQGAGRRFDESVIHRENDGSVVDDDRDPADCALPQQTQARILRQLLEPRVSHSSRTAKSMGHGDLAVALQHPSLPQR